MKKWILFFSLTAFCITITFGMQSVFFTSAYQHTISHLLTKLQSDLGLATCEVPVNLAIKNIKSGEVTLYWDDNAASSWEYSVVPLGGGKPTASGRPHTTKEVVVTHDDKGAVLLPNTDYEFYVRAICDNAGSSIWLGPFDFKTACGSLMLPFSEGFETTSKTKNCWSIVDAVKDGTATANQWQSATGATNAYEGTISMRFLGTGAETLHDDWLISPAIQLQGGTYAITYWYKTSALATAANDFEVLLSTSGTDIKSFTQVLQPLENQSAVAAFKRKVLYVSGITGAVNVAWHVKTKGAATLYVDAVHVSAVNCISPDEKIEVSHLNKTGAHFSWQDPVNTSWEYYVQHAGGKTPVGSGNLINTTKITVTSTNGIGAGPLAPNTAYEFYVRANCGSGKTSIWVGPIAFKLPCNEELIPFWEGFNKNSKTLGCWTVVDRNGDGNTTRDRWNVNGINFEGDQSMYFRGSDAVDHDDWLISPTFKVDDTKKYRLKFHYRTNSSYKTSFRVLLSKQGVSPVDFTEILLSRKDGDTNWKQETLYIGNIKGDINIAWHQDTKSNIAHLYLDNIFLEEIIGCPEPINLGVKDQVENAVTLFWNDPFGVSWEYVVQKSGGNAPIGTGTLANKSEQPIIQDKNGDPLQENTEYEYYLRSSCGPGEFSPWSKPFQFRTGCKVYAIPFWEGFNNSSKSFPCWTIIDANDDALASSNIWLRNSANYEGDLAMLFTGTGSTTLHDDWLISPRLKLDASKTYRLKYHYKTHTTETSDYEFAVALSNSGTDPKQFTKILIPKKKYVAKADWFEETAFITAVSGEVNIGWQQMSIGVSRLSIDNVFVEEVVNCPEPLNLGAKDETSTQATLFWRDDMGGKNWQYYVQKAGGITPTASGTATTTKENIIAKEQSGKNLDPNTDYEFYVRTLCEKGGYSVWKGPFVFTTLCSTYQTPFWEGFNSDSKLYRCWTTVDHLGVVNPFGTLWKITANSKFEGDQGLTFYTSRSNKNFDDWLISPTIDLDGGNYVLKYHYKTIVGAGFNCKFEVLLSANGPNPKDFTKVLVASKNSSTDTYIEEVVFFTHTKGPVNLAWHIDNKDVNGVFFHLDNISLKKIENCPEPYAITISEISATDYQVTWKQDGGISNWEVLVLPHGELPSTNPTNTIKVSGVAEQQLNNLKLGTAVTVYVRALCVDGKTYSDWSTGVPLIIRGTNTDCSRAINVPVNATTACVKKVEGMLYGLNKGSLAAPTCHATLTNDVWYEFTATASTHMVSALNFKSLSGSTSTPIMYGALYDQPCTTMTTTALECFTLSNRSVAGMDNFKIFKNLVPNQKYYLRFGINASTVPDFIFDLCITTPVFGSLIVEESGKNKSVEQLVNEVLINSSCDLVSNVTLQAGDGKNTINTLGYFNKGTSNFPFEEGIVLATQAIDAVPGPYVPNSPNKQKVPKWEGDPNLNLVIDRIGGAGFGTSKYVSVLEFDFISVKDALKFEYIFASDSYTNWCTYACGQGGALFAAWITDLSTGEGQNLALVPGTELPIALSSIRDKEKANLICQSVNPEYYGSHYDNLYGNPLDAPINFVGLTIPMSSESIALKPGGKYRIKLAIADFCPTPSHTSAVFFKAGSFDLGKVDLGEDLLVETNNALCVGDSVTIQSGVSNSADLKKEISWLKDGQLIAGANAPDLTVTAAGVYEMIVTFPELNNCESRGTKKVEFYPAISTVVLQPAEIEICRKSLKTLEVNLKQVEADMFKNVDPTLFTTVYYTTVEAAETAETAKDKIEKPTNYELGKNPNDQTLYLRVENTLTGCHEVFRLPIVVQIGAEPNLFEDISVCEQYVFPAVPSNQFYYMESAGAGKQYFADEVLNLVGEHQIYVLQVNNDQGCYEETSYKVTITAPIVAAVFEDETLDCEIYQLKPLPALNKYYTQPDGKGVELIAGSAVATAQTIYVLAQSKDGLCQDESSFTVNYTVCPIPKGISPNGDGFNDRLDLTTHGVQSLKIYNRWGAEVFTYGSGYTDQWQGQDKGGNNLPDGTYYYVIIARDQTRSGWIQINR